MEFVSSTVDVFLVELVSTTTGGSEEVYYGTGGDRRTWRSCTMGQEKNESMISVFVNAQVLKFGR